MFTRYRTRGLIIKKKDRGESDQELTIFTEDFGKLEITGRAIRKIKSKLRPGAEIFCLSDFEFIQGKSKKTLIEALLVDKFLNIRGDLEKTETAHKIATVANEFITGQEKDEKVWNLLAETFSRLDRGKLADGNQGLVYHFFFWNLLFLLGYSMDLYSCALCGRRLKPEGLYFSLGQGGAIGFGCRDRIEQKEEISKDSLKIIRLFINNDWKILERLKKIESFDFLDKISKNCLTYLNNQRNLI